MNSEIHIKNIADLITFLAHYLRPEGPPCTCSQESSTGGGMAVVTVVVLMSPMMLRASFRAWYMRSISSLCWACSADSSIREFWSPHEYKLASNSAWMNSLVYGKRKQGRRLRKSVMPALFAWKCRSKKHPVRNKLIWFLFDIKHHGKHSLRCWSWDAWWSWAWGRAQSCW